MHYAQIFRTAALALVTAGAAAAQTVKHPELERSVPLPTGYPTDMVLIPAGTFPRGADSEEFAEQPVREIFLSDYLIDKYEVTVAQWGEYQRDTGAMIPEWNFQNAKSRQDHPIASVTWYEAVDFCNWAGKRLPTEAEWERAARCDDGRRYPWGDGLDSFRANYFGSNDPYESGLGVVLQTTPVGFYDGSVRDGYPTRDGSSIFGVHDMVGNVFEWTFDWFSGRYYGISPDSNPRGPIVGEPRDPARPGLGVFGEADLIVKAVRSGSYATDGSHVRTTYRALDPPDLRAWDRGFRCAQSALATGIEAESWGSVKATARDAAQEGR